MGEVYLAQDLKLDRRVAIKILNDRFSQDHSNLKRFVREAKAASALNHPNILVIHEIGETEERNYIVSEFIDGKTLRETMRLENLKLSEVLDVVIQVASALTAAQEARLIHRDIKPENIMLRPDGYVKLLDFGLAKLVEQEPKPFIGFEASTEQHNLTGEGVVLGTVNYMSPEQAKGQDIDARSDIFSLGVVLYEMVGRRTPFAGDSVSETFANLISADPPPLSRYAANVPPELERIVSKMIRKPQDLRYQSMKEVLLDLRDLKENLTADERSGRLRSGQNEVETVVMRDSTQGTNNKRNESENPVSPRVGHRYFLIAAGLLVLLVASAIGFWRFNASSAKATAIDSIAVMPFANESGNADVEYLADGITETLISSLSQLPNLNVKPRSSVFRYKGKETSARVIASELNVQAFLNGKVRQHGNDLSLYVELVEVANERLLWSQSYNRSLTNLVSLQNEIALDVSQKLKTKLSSVDEQKLAKTYTSNSEAYQLYLRGNYHVGRRTEPDIRKGIEYFEQAVAMDPNFALGFAGIASAYVALPNYSKVPWPEVLPKVKEATLRALALDNNLSEAHTMMGTIKVFERNFGEGEREYLRAIELNPNSAMAYHFYAQLFYLQGKFDEAVAQQKKALDLEPLSLVISREYGSKLFWARRYDEAIAQLKKTVELDQGFPSTHYALALAYWMKGSYANSVEEQARFQELIGKPDKARLVRESFAKGGWKGFLETITDERNQFDLAWDNLTPYYAALGDKDRAFAYLIDRYKTSKVRPNLKLDPRLDSLQGDPRYEEFQKQTGS